jgi:nitrogen regulatory protein PII
MKKSVIVHWRSIDDEVIATLTKSGVKAFKWTEVLGCGSETEPKLRPRFWPEENDVLTVVTNDEDANKVKEVVLSLRKAHPGAGIRCFIAPVKEMI